VGGALPGNRLRWSEETLPGLPCLAEMPGLDFQYSPFPLPYYDKEHTNHLSCLISLVQEKTYGLEISYMGSSETKNRACKFLDSSAMSFVTFFESVVVLVDVLFLWTTFCCLAFGR